MTGEKHLLDDLVWPWKSCPMQKAWVLGPSPAEAL